METEDPKKPWCFVEQKAESIAFRHSLMSRGYLVKGLHGDMEQRQRSSVGRVFRVELPLYLWQPMSLPVDWTFVLYHTSLIFTFLLNQKVMFIVLVERHEQEKRKSNHLGDSTRMARSSRIQQKREVK